MPRKAATVPPVEWSLSIPGDLAARVELELFSEVEGKVPYGARRDLMVELLTAWLRTRGHASATQDDRSWS
jgi:hypothetical protein